MKKTIFRLLACSLPTLAPLAATAQDGQERDFSFLPEKIAIYGPAREQAVTREQAIRLLKQKFSAGQLRVMSVGEIRSAVRVLAVSSFERGIMERILKENSITPAPETMAKELRSLHYSLPPAQRQSIEKQLMGNGSNFETYLKKSISDPDNVTRYAFIQWLERSSAAKIMVTDPEAELFYRVNQEIFLIPETIILSRILAPSQNDADAIRTRLALGEKFAAMAQAYNGGKYGEFTRSELDQDILKAVDSLNTGEYSAPVSRKDGWAIFHIDDRVPAQFVPLADVKDYIRREIRKAKILEEAQRIIDVERRKLNFELVL